MNLYALYVKEIGFSLYFKRKEMTRTSRLI